MRYRKLGKTGIEVSEIGFGAWGIGGHMWAGQQESDSRAALAQAYEMGVNFFDTALVYGYGNSERLIGDFVRVCGDRDDLYVATKVHPMNWAWPASKNEPIDGVYPPSHIKQAVNESLRNLKLEVIDMITLHVWADHFADDEAWFETLSALKQVGKVRFIGVSLNSFQPETGVRIVESGKIDFVQVQYNVFEQRPADALFAACEKHDVGVIARSPLEESALGGKLQAGTRFPEGDFRAVYFAGDRLQKTVARVDRVRPVLEEAAGNMVDGALRFALSNPSVACVLPGMRSAEQAAQDVAVSEAGPLPPDVLSALRAHRWDRTEDRW